jgi:cell division protein FtsI/penicillin-binding protein 2
MYVKRRLTPEQRALFEKYDLPDIKILKEPSRFYPFQSASPVIGLTDSDNNGLFGVELLYNKQLAGEPTTVSLQKDARSGHFYFAKETKIEGNEGAPVYLTLDADIQHLAYEELKKSVDSLHALEGAVLVMDPSNGHILAMVSYPCFDSNVRQELDLATTKNKIVTEAYELGSVMKIVGTLALLEEGLVDPNELIDCENTKKGTVNGVTFSTWKAHGLLPFAEVVQRSNNIGSAKVSLRLGSKLYDHYRRMGFGYKTALGWPGEQAGFVNPPEHWSRSSLISLSFGYESRATLLQLAQFFSMIANHGIFIKPTIFKDALVQKEGCPLYSAVAIEQLRTILENTVTQGTAHKAQLEGYRVMGKTGTAIKVINGEYDPLHCMYTFAGIIEKGDYKRVIVTFINDAQVARNVYASTVAVPLFERVAYDVLLHDTLITKETSE